MSLKSTFQGSSLAQVTSLALYTLASLGVIKCYAWGAHLFGFYLSVALILVGVIVTVVSTRRYRQRLNYVEGLERALSEREVNDNESLESAVQTALQPHWIDILGDRGVGAINFLMILVAVPGVLGHASILPQFLLFETQTLESHGFGFGTWTAFVAIESVGFIGLIFEYFGLDELSAIASLGDGFTEYWQWFMAVVQVGLLSLAFDVFRRYLDLTATLDRFIKTIALSGEEIRESSSALQSVLSGGRDRDLQTERALLTVHHGCQSEAYARVETLARFLVVFSKRRIIKKVISVIMDSSLEREIVQDGSSIELCTESRSLLLKAVSLAGMRASNDVILKVSRATALRLLEQQAPIGLRVAALDVLSGYESTHVEDRLAQGSQEAEQMRSFAQDQLRIGSAHAVSTRLSIEYELLSIAASYALSTSPNLSAVTPILVMRYSDAQLLMEESERRLAALHAQLPREESSLLERITEVIDAAHQADDLTIEESLERYAEYVSNVESNLDEGHEKSTLTISEHLTQIIVASVLKGARGPGVLRRLVRLLSTHHGQSFARSLWSVMIARKDTEQSERVLSGLIEGVRADPSLYKQVEALIIDTLCVGDKQEVLRACELCHAFCLDDLSPLPNAIVNAIAERYKASSLNEGEQKSEATAEMLHLACGLARVKGTARLRKELSHLLDMLRGEGAAEVDLILTLELLKSIVGEEEAFSRLFNDYRVALLDKETPERELSTLQDQVIMIMSLIDPSLDRSGRKWAQRLTKISDHQEDRALSSREARDLATELVDTMLLRPSALKLSWMMAFLDTEVSHRVRSHALLLIRSRLKYLEYAWIDPLTDLAPMDWLFDEVISRLQRETDQAVTRQWMRCLSALCLKIKSSDRIDRGVTLLKRVLKAEELRMSASLRGVSAELLGEIGSMHPHLGLSEELINYYRDNQASLAVAIKTGIAKALKTMNDHHALAFFEERSGDATLELRRDGLSAMVTCLSAHRSFKALVNIIQHIRDLNDNEVSAICRPIIVYQAQMRRLFTSELRGQIRNYALEKIIDQKVSISALEASIGLIPLSVTQDDEEVLERLFALVTNVSRQSVLYRVSRCIAETFPRDYEARYEWVSAQLSDDLLPKWIMGLGDLPKSAIDAEMTDLRSDDDLLKPSTEPTGRMVNELLMWLRERQSHVPINPENILELSSKFLEYGHSQERAYVYEWMRLKRYRMIAYAIVQRVVHHGRRDVDLPLLKDQLNRYRATLRRALRAGLTWDSREISTNAKFEIELLDAMSHFGDQRAKVELLDLSVRDAQSDYERAIQRSAIEKLTEEQRRYFGIDLDAE